MYVYTLVVLLLCGLDEVSSRTSHSGIVSHTQADHTHTSSLSQEPDRCGAVAFRCYKPILSYVDSDGEFCGWKNMTSFRELPDVCKDTRQVMVLKWESNALKYQYKFFKTCAEIKKFQQCVRNNQVCRKDYVMSLVMPDQNTFCDNLKTILPVYTCANAWDSSVSWDKLVYTDWRIVQACPATHYRQLSLNTLKLFLFTYITYPSSRTDGVAQSLNAEATGRYICQFMQQELCLFKRGDAVCSGYLSMLATQVYNDQDLIGDCYSKTIIGGKCNKFVKGHCPVDLSTGKMTVTMDYQNITNLYNFTYWRTVSNSEVDILLHTDNKGIGHCDVRNLIFKQLGCLHQYMTHMDINHANKGGYLSQYTCSNIKIYLSCFEAYISSSCPDEAEQFQGIGRFLHAQCGIFRVENTNISCPLQAVYSNVVFNQYSWFYPIMALMLQYVTVIRWKQMNPAPPGLRDVVLNNTDISITYYKSELIKGEKSFSSTFYNKYMISTVCDQEAAVYNDYVTLSTGEQFYQFINHVIIGFEYIKYLAQQKD